jgi:hypothetical protein
MANISVIVGGGGIAYQRQHQKQWRGENSEIMAKISKYQAASVKCHGGERENRNKYQYRNGGGSNRENGGNMAKWRHRVSGVASAEEAASASENQAKSLHRSLRCCITILWLGICCASAASAQAPVANGIMAKRRRTASCQRMQRKYNGGVY